MSYLAASSYSSVRANPSSIVTLYAQVHDNFVRDAHLETASETIRKAAFCSVVANGMAPYGSDSYPNGYNLTTILASPYLECASYSSLTWRLFDLFGSPADVHQVGFNGGAIGNHAQLIVTDGAQSILLDPTIGLIAPGVTLAGLVAGQHYASTMNFFANDPNVQQLTPLVVNALANGLYHIRDGIYDAAGNADAAWNTGITVGTARSGLIGDDNFSWSGQSYGNDGNDTIAGGAGADRIEGGNGRDLLTGSAGNDVFAYHKASDSTFGSLGRDRVLDFTQGSDKIDLHDFAHGALRIWTTTDLNGVHLTRIAADTTGDRVEDFAIDVVGWLPLTSNDFIL